MKMNRSNGSERSPGFSRESTVPGGSQSGSARSVRESGPTSSSNSRRNSNEQASQNPQGQVNDAEFQLEHRLAMLRLNNERRLSEVRLSYIEGRTICIVVSSETDIFSKYFYFI